MSLLTPVALSNSALMQLGQTPITSFADGTQVANACRDEYPICRDIVLEAHPWNFATYFRTLQRLADVPAWGWTYMHSLTTEPYCLRVLQMQYNASFEIGADQYQGRVLFCDLATANVRYVGRVEDLVDWTALALEALTICLGKALAAFITGQQTRRDRLIEEMKQWLASAVDRDSHEGTPHVIPPNRTLVSARHRGGLVNPERVGGW